MVRTRSGSVESVHGAAVRPGIGSSQRSQSVSAGLGGARPAISPGWAENHDVVEEEEVIEEESGDQYADAREDVFGSTMPSEMGQGTGTPERQYTSEDRKASGRR